MRKRALFFSLTFLVTLSFLTGEADAGYSNAIRLAIGARAAAMGGAYRSIADDGNALFYNPGGMGFVDKSVFNLDGGLILANPSYKDPQNSERDGNQGSSGLGGFPDFGVVTQLGDSPLRLGLSLNTYTSIRMKYDIQAAAAHATAGSTALADFNLNLIHQRFTTGLAYQVTDWLSLGGGAILSYEQFGQALPSEFTSSVAPAILSGVDYIEDRELDGFGQGGIFGALIKIGEKTQIGASYTTKMDVELHGNQFVEIASGAFDGQRVEYDIDQVSQWPQVFGAGISHQFTDELLGAFDFQWIDWSTAYDKGTSISSEGNNSVVTSVVGTTIRDSAPRDFDDAMVFHFGGEYTGWENMALRAGYVFSTNPVPDSTFTPIVNGNFQHTISLGLGTNLDGWGIDAAYSHTFANEQSVGVSSVSTDEAEFNNSTIENSNDIFFLSFKKPF